MLMREVTVIKRRENGAEVWRYSGQELQAGERGCLIEALFNRDDQFFNDFFLGRGDRFVEAYFTQRWFNIYEIHARGSDELRGYYCNVSAPAEISDSTIAYNDLALDLLVFADGRQKVLDEDEFAALNLPEDISRQARQALTELQQIFNRRPGLRLERDFADLLAEE
jgi:hypothetical protein